MTQIASDNCTFHRGSGEDPRVHRAETPRWKHTGLEVLGCPVQTIDVEADTGGWGGNGVGSLLFCDWFILATPTRGLTELHLGR